MNPLLVSTGDDEARSWEHRYVARLERLLAPHRTIVTRRTVARERMLGLARARRMGEASLARTDLELLIMIHPLPAGLERLVAPFDDAAIAYVDHLEGSAAAAIERMTRAIVVHGEVARDHRFPERHATQIHLGVNLARCHLADGRSDRAAALLDALTACAGDPTAWPFADGAHDPWSGLPASVAASLHAQIDSARRRIPPAHSTHSHTNRGETNAHRE